MSDPKDSWNTTTEMNMTDTASEIDYVYTVGAVVSSVCIIINGLLLICTLNNRKKPWIRNRQDLTSLIASDFVSGIVLVMIFAVRHALSLASSNVLRLAEEAIYFTSKCIIINHLLLMCFNSLLNLNKKKRIEGRNNSFHVQSLLIWMTTLSWLVVPFMLLGNGCSTFWFTECTLQDPTIMLQFLSFMFGLPLILANIFYGSYALLIFKDAYSLERAENKWETGSQTTDKSRKIHTRMLSFRDQTNDEPEINRRLVSKIAGMALLPNTCSAKDTAKAYSPEPCIVHQSSFKAKQEKAKERGNRQGIKNFIATGLMLLALDISVWPIVFSFVRLLFKVDAPGLRNLLILTFSSQVANPIIYLMTLPNLRLTFKKMMQISTFRSGKNKASRARVTPPLTCSFKRERTVGSNSHCNCPKNWTRRRTADVILENEEDRKGHFVRNQPLCQSDSLLSRDVSGEHKCVNMPPQYNRSQSYKKFSENLLRLSLARKHSLMSGRSAISGGGFSIEMDSQVSVSDILSCEV